MAFTYFIVCRRSSLLPVLKQNVRHTKCRPARRRHPSLGIPARSPGYAPKPANAFNLYTATLCVCADNLIPVQRCSWLPSALRTLQGQTRTWFTRPTSHSIHRDGPMSPHSQTATFYTCTCFPVSTESFRGGECIRGSEHYE